MQGSYKSGKPGKPGKPGDRVIFGPSGKKSGDIS